MNRKAEVGDQIFIFYFVFILFMIIGGILIGDYFISGKAYDIRMQDAEILSGNIIRCLENENQLTQQKIADLFITCNFDEKTFEKGLIVSINTQEKDLFRYGNVVACGLQDKNEDYPKCKNSFLNVEIQGEETELYIITGSNLKAENKNG